MAVYAYGTTVRVKGTFYGTSGQLVDPPGVMVQIRSPTGELDTYTITDTPTIIERLSVGLYVAVIRATATGRWLYGWSSTTPDEIGTQPAEEGYFDVKRSGFAA